MALRSRSHPVRCANNSAVLVHASPVPLENWPSAHAEDRGVGCIPQAIVIVRFHSVSAATP